MEGTAVEGGYQYQHSLSTPNTTHKGQHSRLCSSAMAAHITVKEEKGDHLCLAGNLSVQKMLATLGAFPSMAPLTSPSLLFYCCHFFVSFHLHETSHTPLYEPFCCSVYTPTTTSKY